MSFSSYRYKSRWIAIFMSCVLQFLVVVPVVLGMPTENEPEPGPPIGRRQPGPGANGQPKADPNGQPSPKPKETMIKLASFQAAAQPAPNRNDIEQKIKDSLTKLYDGDRIDLWKKLTVLITDKKYQEALQLAKEASKSIVDQLAPSDSENKLNQAQQDELFNFYAKLEDLIEALQIHPLSYKPQENKTQPEKIIQLANTPRQLRELREAFREKSESMRRDLEYFLWDLSNVKTPEELKLLEPGEGEDRIDVRVSYQLKDKFHLREKNNRREVWVLEIGSGERVIVGFDRETNTIKIVYTEKANPHIIRNKYNPQAEEAIARFLKGW